MTELLSDLLLLSLLVLAVACGWWLGRRQRGQAQPAATQQYHYQGLNYLLNEQNDAALDQFINALEVNAETLDTHLAVGSLMRRRGEVDRAIRIHQNLLSRPSLPQAYQQQAHLELARDFIAAGLLDRAERLLEDLQAQAPQMRPVAMRHLIEIYQDEKEWQQALDTGKQLLPRRSFLSAEAADPELLCALAHYCCELAELAQADNDIRQARIHLQQALDYDRGCVRASLLLAQIEAEAGRCRQGIKALRAIRRQDPDLLPEALTLLRQLHQQDNSLPEYRQFLDDCLQQQPSATLLLALADEIQHAEGEQQAIAFISAQLQQRPSLRGLSRLVQLQLQQTGNEARQNLGLVQDLIAQLLSRKPRYRCQHCGFAGRHLHWLCPSCKRWGEIKPVRGAEGD